MSLVSLANVTPSPRYDGIPFNRAIIQEAAQAAGAWAALTVINLIPLDADPASPRPRSFTFQGTIENGYYRVIFEDADGVLLDPTIPIHNIISYTPSIAQVGALLRARTKDDVGNEIGTFNDKTRPTEDQVLELISNAIGTLSIKIGDSVPDALLDEASQLAAIRTAMLIELSFFPEMIKSGRSPYDAYENLWKEGYGDGKTPGTLVNAITAAAVNGGDVLATEPGLVSYSFPSSANLGSRRL